MCHNLQIGSSDCCAIQMLPVEILAQIFSNVLANSRYLSANKRLASLLLVCRRWNGVIESSTLLWCWLDNFSPNSYNTAALAKSRDSPLHILWGSGRNPFALMESERFWEFIVPQARRWQDVHIIRLYGSMEPSAMNVFEPWLVPLPKLRTFERHAHERQTLDIGLKIEVNPGHNITMGHLVFQENAWHTTPLWSHIKPLDLDTGKGASEMPPSRFEELIALNPQIESLSLTIRGGYPAPPGSLFGPIPISGPKFHMPSLRRLKLATFRDRIVRFLDRLEAPNLRTSWFELYTWAGDDILLRHSSDEIPLLQRVFGLVRDLANAPVALRLELNPSEGFRADFSDAKRRTTLEYRGLLLKTRLQIQWVLDGFRLQLLPDVVSTELVANHEHFYADTACLLMRLPHVHSLILTNWYQMGDLAFLGPSFTDNHADPPQTYDHIFPELRNLTLPKEAQLPSILDMLAFRQSGKTFPLETLRLFRNDWEGGDLDQIRGSLGACQLEIVGG